ncbi:MAG: leucine-rich repeat domain-containing protein [bacterium]|nr:leucine-rich repeat domain-containing protein [bacterium]
MLAAETSQMIGQLEEEIGEKLELLDLEEIEGSLKRGFALDSDGNVTGLNLDKLHLKKLPHSLFSFDHLQSLSLFGNQLTDLSPFLVLTRLTRLAVGENKLTRIVSLEGLNQLTSLDLTGNRLEDISGLRGLDRLEVLSLDDNKISDISHLGSLSSLNTLYIAENRLVDIDVLGELSGLNILYLRKNGIIDIEAVLGLKNLILLDVMENQVRRLSGKILDLGMEIDVGSRFHCGEGLFLYGNPLETPPMEVLEEGNDAVAEYFASRASSAV